MFGFIALTVFSVWDGVELSTIAHSGRCFDFWGGVWDGVELTLEVGFIGPFALSDPTDSGATIAPAQALCLTIVNPPPTQDLRLSTY